VADRHPRAAPKQRRAAAATAVRIPEVLPAKTPSVASAPRGPVPPPFASAAPAAEAAVAEEDEDAEEEEAAQQEETEPLSAEQYAEWMKYYRDCAEYFEQCEKNCALE
ncbi:MCAT, partial [Symbiodinium pilosum]